MICLPLSLLSRSSVRVKSHTHDPVQVLDEAKDSINSIHLSSMTFQLVHVKDPMDGKLRYDIRFGKLYTDTIGRMCNPHTHTHVENILTMGNILLCM